jgi:hypothetical protein
MISRIELTQSRDHLDVRLGRVDQLAELRAAGAGGDQNERARAAHQRKRY